MCRLAFRGEPQSDLSVVEQITYGIGETLKLKPRWLVIVERMLETVSSPKETKQEKHVKMTESSNDAIKKGRWPLRNGEEYTPNRLKPSHRKCHSRITCSISIPLNACLTTCSATEDIVRASAWIPSTRGKICPFPLLYLN